MHYDTDALAYPRQNLIDARILRSAQTEGEPMRRSRRQMLVLLAVAVGLLGGSVARGEDVAPDWRGNPGTALGGWKFEKGDTKPAPDRSKNPSDRKPDSSLEVEGTAVYFDTALSGRKGAWKLVDTPNPPAPGGRMVVRIPNVDDQQGIKEMWIQITYLGTLGEPDLGVPNVFQRFDSKKNPVGDGWVHWVTKWTSPVCPPTEEITIKPGLKPVLIDELFVDTICRR